MKGNQGLEALAALCGGRPKAVDTVVGNSSAPAPPTSITNGSGASPSSPSRTSPKTTVSSFTTVKSASPVAAAVAAANTMLMRQAAERTAREAASTANATGANGGSAPTQQQQNSPPVAAAAPIRADNLTTSGAPGTSALSSLTPQQISQAIVTAANSQGGRLDPALAQSLLYPAGLRGAASELESVAAATPVPTLSVSNNNILANTMQQLVIQQYLQAQANVQQQVQQQQQAHAAAAAVTTNGHQQAALLAMALAAGKPGQPQQHFLPISASTTTTSTAGAPDHRSSQGSSSAPLHQQQQAQAQAQALLQHAAQHQQQQLSAASFTSIKPASTAIHQQAQAIQQQYHFPNGAPASAGGGDATANLPSMIQIAATGGRILPSAELAPQNSAVARIGVSMKDGENTNAARGSHGIKKQQKRAANRRSAQLSRKRKKQFIEELKEENDDLRRKEQILRAIPDLIVVFDSSGRLGFVSESVGRFLRVRPSKLEGTSFWDLICEESVRMLKAAFMDSLAAREADSDTAVLGAGVWELRLKDKNSKYMIVTLNGVVHFKGDAPECVCCIRPVREEQQQQKQQEQQTQEQQQKQPLPSKQQPKSDGIENTESGGEANKSKNIRPVSCSDGDASRTSDGSNGTQQSVLNMSSAERDEAANDAKKRNKKFRRMMASAEDDDSQYSNDRNSNNVEADGTNNSVRISDGDSNDGIESD